MRLWKLAAPTMVLILLLAACGGPSAPAAPTSPPTPPPTAIPATSAPEGVTALEVQQLIAEKLNTPNLDQALWGIQPGLGTVMVEYGRRVAIAYMAVQAGDWALAQYQLSEAIEIQEVGETTRPEKAASLAEFEHSYLDPLLADIQAKDVAAYNEDFSNALTACNACHVAYGHPYVVVQPPTTSPEDFLAFSASDPEPEEGSEEASTPTTAADTPLSWAELYAMVDGTFNTVDRTLALWNIQPGLGTVMMEYGRRFSLAKLAADAGDWGMAQYQLSEAIEVQEVGEATRPARADMLAAFEHGYLDALAQDILDKDSAGFNTDYEAAVAGCNACHQASGHPFIRFAGPQTSPQPFLAFGATDPEAPEESAPAATLTPISYPPGVPTRDDASRLIDERLSSIDRTLTLWNIQPGLGTVMMEYGYRFALAYQAAKAGNWGMAEYQLDEATEIQEVGETTRPARADMLKAFEDAYLAAMIEAAKAKDAAAFETATENAVTGCNACHQALGHPYVVVQYPPNLSVDFLNLK